MDDEEQKPKRRVRYTGTHPKTFKEKYKELNPEQYKADIEKVIQQGRTPAGMHRSICVQEIMNVLKVVPGQVGYDATLGYGGHSLEILKHLNGKGKLYATDVDPFELPRTKERLNNLGYGDDILTVRKMNFSGIDQIAAEAGPLNFVLADLGVSSMQIDNPERGFTFKVDGPLDLRLNPKSGKPASALLKSISEEDLQAILMEYSDEPYAELIAEKIKSHLKEGNAINTTLELKEVISDALTHADQRMNKDDIKKTCQRVFQALRIEVNNEFEVLETFLEKLPDALRSGDV